MKIISRKFSPEFLYCLRKATELYGLCSLEIEDSSLRAVAVESEGNGAATVAAIVARLCRSFASPILGDAPISLHRNEIERFARMLEFGKYKGVEYVIFGGIYHDPEIFFSGIDEYGDYDKVVIEIYKALDAVELKVERVHLPDEKTPRFGVIYADNNATFRRKVTELAQQGVLGKMLAQDNWIYFSNTEDDYYLSTIISFE